LEVGREGQAASRQRALPLAVLREENIRYNTIVRNNNTTAAALAIVNGPAPVLERVNPIGSDEQYHLATVRADAAVALSRRGETSEEATAIRAAAAEAEAATRRRSRGTLRRLEMVLSQIHLIIIAIVESKRVKEASVAEELRKIASEEYSKAKRDPELPVPDAFNRARINSAITAANAAAAAAKTNVVTPNFKRKRPPTTSWNNNNNGGGFSNSNNNNNNNGGGSNSNNNNSSRGGRKGGKKGG
jgi:hypothetical protein